MDLVSNVIRPAARIGLKARKYSPVIALGVGVGMIIYGVVKACQKSKTEVVEIDAQYEKEVLMIDEPSEETKEAIKSYKQEISKCRRKKFFGYVKAYLVPVLIIVGGFVLILSGYGIINYRYLAAVESFNFVSAQYDGYRGTVRKTYGEEAETRIFNGVIEELSEEVDILDKDGIPTGDKEVHKKLKMDPDRLHQVFGASTSPFFKKSHAANMAFLKQTQNYLNDRLHRFGSISYNEFLEAVYGVHNGEGSIFGWVLDKDGKGYIDFGLFDRATGDVLDTAIMGLNAETNTYDYRLDVRPDGILYDLI